MSSVALRGALTSNTLIEAIYARFVGVASKVCTECSACPDKVGCHYNLCTAMPRCGQSVDVCAGSVVDGSHEYAPHMSVGVGEGQAEEGAAVEGVDHGRLGAQERFEGEEAFAARGGATETSWSRVW